MKKVVVIGGGPAGLMASGVLKKNGAEVTLLEKNASCGKKLLITGKGRCNVTNNCTLLNNLISNVPTNGRFLFSAFSNFSPTDTIEFFEKNGVPLKIERGDRVFPESDKSSDILWALEHFALSNGVNIKKNAEVCDILLSDGHVCGVKLKDGGEIPCDMAVIATGGVSYKKTGSTGDGYIFAKKAGHRIIDPKPSLVGLKCREGFCSDVMGLSLKNVAITILDTETYHEVYRDFGEMLFTHFGVSGPIILSASAHLREMKRAKFEIHIDLKPALSHEKLDERIKRDFLLAQNKNFINALDSLLPKKLVPIFVKLLKIKPSKKVNQITREERGALCNLLKDLKLTVLDFAPIDEAIITSGGVCVDEINPKTMESKLCKGLFFAGEVIDCDAYTGGFNLQIAFSTANLVGQSIL